MKNTILFLLLCCVFAPCMLFAQTEFSQTGTQWKTNYFSAREYTTIYTSIDYTYELRGDTLLNSKIYKKLFQNENLIGAFLEEERKVWYYPFFNDDFGSERILLYDFSLEKGDKIETYQIPWNTGGSLSQFDFLYETATITIENVYYEQGRKVMEVRDDSYSNGFGGDIWIEGIGSPFGFWGAYLAIPTNGNSTDTSLTRALNSNGNAIYYKGEIITSDYQSTFLKENKTWEIQNPQNGIFKIVIGKPQMINDYPSYPVYKNGYFMHGYLYDVNGTIYWIFDSKDRILDCDYLLYNFDLSVGNQFPICVELYHSIQYWAPPKFEWYNVTQVYEVQYRGKSLKRIVLEGGIRHVWLENVGSLNSLLYLDCDGYHLDTPQHKLLRCYIGDEVIYDSADFPDGIEESIASAPTYIVADGQLTIKEGVGYSLSLYDISGIEIYARNLTETTEIIPLSDLSPTLMVGKLQKEELVITFKIKGSDE